MKEINSIPRRTNQQTMEPSELAILNAMYEVEKLPAHPKETEAVILLSRAKDLIADVIEELVLPNRETEKTKYIVALQSDYGLTVEQSFAISELIYNLLNSETAVQVSDTNPLNGSNAAKEPKEPEPLPPNHQEEISAEEKKHIKELKSVMELDKAINCLYLELPKEVAKAVQHKFYAMVDAAQSLTNQLQQENQRLKEENEKLKSK